MNYFVHSHSLTHFVLYTGPEVEKRIDSFRAEHGPVLFGGRLGSTVEDDLAIPDNLGGSLSVEEPNAAR